MKKSILFFPRLLGLALFTFLLVQCKKDEAPPKPASELILGTWKLSADTYSPAYDYFGNGTKITDAYPLYVDCQKDDVTTFKTNSEGEFNEGASKCDVADPQSTPFLWTLKDNNTTLNISALADFKIVSIDATTLKLSTTFDENSVTYTETFTFTKK
jgi:outer membrane lipoprotein-sorting protein